ncbi:MAG: NAD-reducing hydrogenase HoxS subunit beta [Syntrophomonadaceae bacterium]|nr:NAD-reducing hydrogenase HoxS subunit beta [Bacillota bacterium]
MSEKQIKVDYIARVEGGGALDIRISDGEILDLKLKIWEPPRFFQSFLVGRRFDEVPDMTARICGICPVSYMMTSIEAIEDAFGITVSQQTRDLRRLLALSQWIQSHTLHVYMLAAPDFLGYESVIAMVSDYPEVVKRALRMKKLGNDLTRVIGGREINPVNPVVKGFSRVSAKSELWGFIDRLKEGKEDALETVRLVSSLPIPDFNRKAEHLAVSHESEYGVNYGKLVSTGGLNISVKDYRKYIKERQVSHSNTLHSYIEGRDSFLVGPLARVNINFDQLTPDAQKAARESGISFPNFNPFVSIVARAIELVHSMDECLEIIERLDPKDEDVRFEVKAGEGWAATEAPRGLLYHSYKINSEGIIEKADIVAPTSHNLYSMESDLWQFVPTVLDLPLEEATLKCEMIVRNYDPCISCSCHFLKLNIRRE